MSMTVNIWTDINCPFCYLGKQRFLDALADFDHRDDVTVVHRSFELDPTLAHDTTGSVEQYLASKYGISTEQARANEERLGAQATEMGLPYQTRDRDFGNSFDMHRLLQYARTIGKQEALVDALYAANFAAPQPLFGDRERLLDVAVEAGLDRTEVTRILDDPTAYADDVRRDEREAAELGATGVPFFVIDDTYAVSGAQSPETFGRALATAWADRPPLVDLTTDAPNADAGTPDSRAACAPDGCALPMT